MDSHRPNAASFPLAPAFAPTGALDLRPDPSFRREPGPPDLERALALLERTLVVRGAASMLTPTHHPPVAWLDQLWGELDHVLAALRWLGDHGDPGRATYLAHGTLRFWSDRSRRFAVIAYRARVHESLRLGVATALCVDYRCAATLCDACRELIRVLGARERAARSAIAAGAPSTLAARHERSAAIKPLTPRERQVAALIARGHTNREIAIQLVIAERTVTSHVVHILDKSGFRSRVQVAAWAVQEVKMAAGGESVRAGERMGTGYRA